MERKEQLCRALRKTAWGYMMLYFDINLGTIDILPSWLGFILFYQAIRDGISKEEESAGLLKPISILPGVYYGMTWLLKIFGISTDTYLIDEIIAVISLYFHFQFLTNLANIAGKYGCTQKKSILILRTAQTVLLTLLAFAVQFQELYKLTLFLAVVQIAVMICLCIVLHGLKKALTEIPDEQFEIYCS